MIVRKNKATTEKKKKDDNDDDEDGKASPDVIYKVQCYNPNLHTQSTGTGQGGSGMGSSWE